MSTNAGSSKAAQFEVELEEIIGQCWVAFGQGTGSVNVSRVGVAAGRRLFLERYNTAENRRNWDQDALRVLEFVRAIGRLAAQRATAEGLTVIHERQFQQAAEQVLGEARMMALSQCPYC